MRPKYRVTVAPYAGAPLWYQDFHNHSEARRYSRDMAELSAKAGVPASITTTPHKARDMSQRRLFRLILFMYAIAIVIGTGMAAFADDGQRWTCTASGAGRASTCYLDNGNAQAD